MNMIYSGKQCEFCKIRPKLLTKYARQAYLEENVKIVRTLTESRELCQKCFKAPLKAILNTWINVFSRTPKISSQISPVFSFHSRLRPKLPAHGVFPVQSYRVWDLVRAHNRMIRVHFDLGMV